MCVEGSVLWESDWKGTNVLVLEESTVYKSDYYNGGNSVLPLDTFNSSYEIM